MSFDHIHPFSQPSPIMNESRSIVRNMDSACGPFEGAVGGWWYPWFGTMQVHSPTLTMPARRHCHWPDKPRLPRLVTYRYANGPLSRGPQPATHHHTQAERSHYWHSASWTDRKRLRTSWGKVAATSFQEAAIFHE